MIEESAEYDGNKIIYFKSIADHKKSIFLFHGYSFESSVWDKINLPVSINKIGFSVYAFDMPGFPKSRNKNVSVSSFFAFLKNFASRMGRIALLGASAGGYLAAKFSEENPKLVEHLILVGAVRLEEITLDKDIKVLGIWGSEDEISNPDAAKRNLSRFNSKFVLIEGARHACYLDKPEAFTEEVIRFLK